MKKKRTVQLDDDIHGWISDIAAQADVEIIDVVRDMYRRYKDGGAPITDFKRIRLEQELKRLSDKRAAMQEKEEQLRNKITRGGDY